MSFAYRSREVCEVEEWLTVRLDDDGQVASTERVPGPQFRSIDRSKVVNLPESQERLTFGKTTYSGDYYSKELREKPVGDKDD